MAIQYSTTHRTNSMTQLNTDIGPNAQIIIYTGSMPANVGTAATGTLLVQFAGNAGGFGSASAGVLTAAAVANAQAMDEVNAALQFAQITQQMGAEGQVAVKFGDMIDYLGDKLGVPASLRNSAAERAFAIVKRQNSKTATPIHGVTFRVGKLVSVGF